MVQVHWSVSGELVAVSKDNFVKMLARRDEVN